MADVESKTAGYAEENEKRNDSIYAEKAEVSDFKASAIEAENAEHNMTVLQAVRAYPMASFWAFIVSFSATTFSAAITRLTDPPDVLHHHHGILRRLPHGQLPRPPRFH